MARECGLALLDTPPCGDKTAARMGHPVLREDWGTGLFDVG
jgi:hypothetical protein